MGVVRPASLLSKTPCASVCETSIPTATEPPLYLCEAVLRDDLVPGFFDRSGQYPNELDCEQQNSCDHSTHGAQSNYENGTFRSSTAPQKQSQLMPTIVHMVSDYSGA
jgi:hypothetical protein